MVNIISDSITIAIKKRALNQRVKRKSNWTDDLKNPCLMALLYQDFSLTVYNLAVVNAKDSPTNFKS